MRFLLIPTVAAAGLLVVEPSIAQPSYGCSGQLNATERTICQDNILAQLDQEMADKFYAISNRLSDERKGNFRREQTRWRKNRDACGPAVGCIMANYVYRIGQLDAIAGDAPFGSFSARVLPDGTIERRLPNGVLERRLPNGTMESYGPDGQKISQNVPLIQVQEDGLPPLPPAPVGWSVGLRMTLLEILNNILPDEQYAAYRSTEAGKEGYALVDWRLRSISLLTEP